MCLCRAVPLLALIVVAPPVMATEVPLPSRSEPAGGTPASEASERMVAAHASLRTLAVADPDSRENHLAFEGLIRRMLSRRAADPVDPVPAVVPSGDLVASLEGSFSVDNKGGGAYWISLRHPPSRDNLGFRPAISYQTPVGASLLGWGCSLATGFPHAITRGRSLVARDGEGRGATLSPSDQFYLDGKLLLPVLPETGPIAPGHRLQTEVLSDRRQIEATGREGRVEGFVLRDDKGRTMFFGRWGGSEDGFQPGFDEARGTLGEEAFTFALKRVEDEFGRYLEFHYEHRGFGEWILASIDYTGSRTRPPEFAMRLRHGVRSQSAPTYKVLHRRDEGSLLEAIEVVEAATGTALSRYTFHYHEAPADGADRLERIEAAFRTGGDAPWQAASPTRLIWSRRDAVTRAPRPLALPPSWLADPVPTEGRLPAGWGDFDGDGIDEHVTWPDGGLRIERIADNALPETTLKITARALAKIIGGRPLAWHTADFDGDGGDDLLLATEGGRLAVWRAVGGRLESWASLDLAPFLSARELDDASFWPRLVVADRNCDGRADLLLLSAEGEGQSWLSERRGWRHSSHTFPLSSGARIATAFGLDLNNDGNEDLAWEERKPTGQYRLRAAVALPAGGFGPPMLLDEGEQTSPSFHLLCGDFNDDGHDDLLRLTATASARWEGTVWLSRGPPPDRVTSAEAAFVRMTSMLAEGPPANLNASAPGAHLLASHTPRRAGPFSLLDENGDGWDDLVWAEGGKWFVTRSNGDGTFAQTVLSTSPHLQVLSSELLPEDGTQVRADLHLNGDGVAEWVLARGGRPLAAADGRQVVDGACPFPRLVTAIIDGRGKTLELGYHSARDPEIYVRGATVLHPIRESGYRRPVVTSVWKDQDADRRYQISYYYSGHRTDIASRGTLGYAAFLTQDHQTGFFKHQQVAQSFPVTGLTVREDTFRHWQEGDTLKFKRIKQKSNLVVFDAVRDPFTHRLTGSLFPFMASSNEDRWTNDFGWDYAVPARAFRVPLDTPHFLPDATESSPFLSTKAEVWMDLRDLARPADEGLPTFRTPFLNRRHRLRGDVTYGLISATSLTQTGKRRTVTRSTYHPVTGPRDPLVSRKHTEMQYLGQPDRLPGEAASSQFFYYEGSDELRRHEEHDVDLGDGILGLRVTHYERDERGVLLRREVYTQPAENGPGAEPTTTVPYEIFELDPARELPVWLRDEEDGERRVSYDAWSQPVRDTYPSGVVIERTYDGQGRLREFHNRGNGFAWSRAYAWTRPGDEGWRATQVVTPPPAIEAQPGTSVLAVRIEANDRATRTSYHDRLDRLIRTVEENPDEAPLLTDIVFNGENERMAESAPYHPGDPIAWTVFSYDSYGREISQRNLEEDPRPH
jgi:YD repeat-containing protein